MGAISVMVALRAAEKGVAGSAEVEQEVEEMEGAAPAAAALAMGVMAEAARGEEA